MPRPPARPPPARPGRARRPCLDASAARAAPGRAGGLAGAALLLAGCVAGPDYVRPEVATPPAWKLEAPWRAGAPDDAAPKGPWWQRFGDARLDALQRQALAQSPTLVLAAARLEQARAVVRVASAGQLPNANIAARATRQHISANRPLTNYGSENFSTVQNDFVPLLVVSYELDIAGRVRRSVEGAQASAEQSAADLENTRLLLGADLATAYFNLRATDIELDVAGPLDRPAAALARFRERAPRARRLLGARGGAAAGAARHHADPGRPAAPPARPVRARGRHPDRHAGAGVRARARHRRARAADGAARRALRRAAAPARRRLGRAGDGGGERADRRRQRRLLSEHHDQPRARLRGALAHQPVRGVERALVARRDRDAAALQRRPARAPTSTSPAPTTTPPSPTTGGSS